MKGGDLSSAAAWTGEGNVSRLAVIATIAVKPEAREAVVDILRRHRQRCLRNEPGTLVFEMMVPRDEADKIMLYEAYDSQAAFDAHWNGASLAMARQEPGRG